MASSQSPRLLRPRFLSLITALLIAAASLGSLPVAAQHGSAAPATGTGMSPAVYIVQLKDAPLASYSGDLPGLSATSPRASGAQLDLRSAASRSYLSYLRRQRTAALQALSKLTGAPARPLRTFEIAFNGLALTLTPAQAKQATLLPQVAAVTRQELLEQASDVGPTLIGALTGSDPDTSRAALARAGLDGSQEVPATASQATGRGTFVYNATTKQLAYQIGFTGLTPTAAHIHLGAPGVSGAVQFDLGMPAGQAYIGQVALDNAQETALYAGDLYVNIHTAAHVDGEIRGQIKPDLGEDALIGIIDSGINANHPSFQDPGQDGYDYPAYPRRFGICDPANPNYSKYSPPFPCNDKLVGAWSFTTITQDTSPLGEYSPYDDNGHGSHVASIAGGNIVVNPMMITGQTIPRISGVAPHARIIAYDAGNASFTNDAVVAAIDQAAKDGVQVLNMSLGGRSTDPWKDPISVASLGARDAGLMVVAAAGNSGPTPSSSSSPSNSPWVISVGASTHGRVLTFSSLADLSGGSSTPPALSTIYSHSLGTGATPLPIVLAQTIDPANALCKTKFAANSASGKIVVCDRGELPVVAKGVNVAAGGAAGVIVVSIDPGEAMFDAPFSVPGVFLDHVDGAALKSWLAAGSDHQGRIAGSQVQQNPANADIVSDFSSRGPDAFVPSVLKPEVTAPGKAILAAVQNTNPTEAEYDVFNGTSMAAPHTAGAAALLRSLHPDWTPSEIQSALMTTAITLASAKNNDALVAATPFDQGAGRIDVGRAALAGLVLDESMANFKQANPAAGGDPGTLNLPSLAAGECFVTCSWTRTVRSTLAAPATWNVAASGSAVVTLSVSPSSFTLQPGARQTITVTATVKPEVAEGAYLFGEVRLTAADNLAPSAALPVALRLIRSNQPKQFQIYTLAPTGSRIIPQIRTFATNSLAANVVGLVKGTATVQTIAPEDIKIVPVVVPANTLRLVAETVRSTAIDVDLYIVRDMNGDGRPQEDEQVCSSQSSKALEHCSLDNPVAGNYMVILENYQGSSAKTDTITLVTALVPTSGSTGNLTATVPATVDPRSPFDATLSFNLPAPKRGDRWYGVLLLNSGSGATASLHGRTNVDVSVDPSTTISLPITLR